MWLLLNCTMTQQRIDAKCLLWLPEFMQESMVAALPCSGAPVEEAQMLLDDHVVKSQAMAASPFSKPFEERLVPWEQKLRRFQVPTAHRVALTSNKML